MQRRMKKAVVFVSALLALCTAVSGCKSLPPAQGGQAQQKVQPVTLKIFHYQNEGIQTFTKIIHDFEETHPNIKVQADISGGDQYDTILKTRFLSNESMDIVGIHPGKNTAITYAQGGYLKELSNEPFLQGIDSDALKMGLYNGKYYGLPIDISYIVCFYNKKIFQENGLSIPTTWNQYLALCEKLKSQSVTPLALGIKDLWITQMIAYALSATTIYKENINFDQQMYQGDKKFLGPEWRKTLGMYRQLTPYFNNEPLNTSYDQQLALFAQGETAMMVMGTWGIRLVQQLNPKLDFGVFVLPASDDGNNWTCSAVGGMLGISSTCRNEAAAKEFLSYFMSDSVYREYLQGTMNLPVKKSIDLSYNPIMKKMASNVSHTYNFLDQNWPSGEQEYLLKGVQEMFAGESIDNVLKEMDRQWETKYNNMLMRQID